jgi:dTDP-4-amino-4,6-dideoxygalactose transaminase
LKLDHFEDVRRRRAAVDRLYSDLLGPIEGIDLIDIPADVEPNHSYFPILVRESFPIDRDTLYEVLKAQGIYSRRYFYPLLSSLPVYAGLPSAAPGRMPVAEQAAAQVLCLPIYPDLSEADQRRIVQGVLDQARG